ncbi:hypothetical protein BGZ65_002343 [Modicella reniformis]|uniref:Uncharacterized protein n=1 Tax=Modicella reniformis TaxID=1440133 RepID=A0A9P6LS73_9FUNG|nr:hypothetical protein BGZ65_002343 [Modicella reniformis]
MLLIQDTYATRNPTFAELVEATAVITIAKREVQPVQAPPQDQQQAEQKEAEKQVVLREKNATKRTLVTDLKKKIDKAKSNIKNDDDCKDGTVDSTNQRQKEKIKQEPGDQDKGVIEINSNEHPHTPHVDEYLADLWKGIVHFEGDPTIQAGISTLNKDTNSASQYAHQQHHQHHQGNIKRDRIVVESSATQAKGRSHATRSHQPRYRQVMKKRSGDPNVVLDLKVNVAPESQDRRTSEGHEERQQPQLSMRTNIDRDVAKAPAAPVKEGLQKRQNPLVVVKSELEPKNHIVSDTITNQTDQSHRNKEVKVAQGDEVVHKIFGGDSPEQSNNVHKDENGNMVVKNDYATENPEPNISKEIVDNGAGLNSNTHIFDNKKKLTGKKVFKDRDHNDILSDNKLVGDVAKDNMDNFEDLFATEEGNEELQQQQRQKKNKDGDKKQDLHDYAIEVDPLQDMLRDIFGDDKSDSTDQDQRRQQEKHQQWEHIIKVQENKKKHTHEEHQEEVQSKHYDNQATHHPQADTPVPVPADPHHESHNDNHNNSSNKPPIQPQNAQQGVTAQPSEGPPEGAAPEAQPGTETKAGARGSSGGYGTVPMFGPAQLDLGSGSPFLTSTRSSLGLTVALVVVMMTTM